MYKLCFYVPETHLEVVKSALFEIGAGKVGDYDSCCWQALGQGQFRPLKGSDPYVGQQGKIESVAEYKVEMVFDPALLNEVIAVLRKAHPYEEPAFDIISMIDSAIYPK